MDWNFGLQAKAAALWLSHQRVGTEEGVRASSWSRDLIHRTSDAAIASSLYSNSVLDLETTTCFF